MLSPHLLRMRILVALTLFCGVLAAQDDSARPEFAGRQWEYASVSGQSRSGNVASICFATASGCRRERVVADSNAVVIGDTAIMKATYKLASEGWELVTSDSDGEGSRTLMFRRPKAKTLN